MSPPPDRQVFARLLSHVMLDRDMKQPDLAKRVGVSQQAVSNWILGRTTPTRQSVEALARALDVPVGELLVAAGYSSLSGFSALPAGTTAAVGNVPTDPERQRRMAQLYRELAERLEELADLQESG